MTNTSSSFEITETELSSFNIAVAPFVFNEYVYDNLSVGALLIMIFSFIESGIQYLYLNKHFYKEQPIPFLKFQVHYKADFATMFHRLFRIYNY